MLTEKPAGAGIFRIEFFDSGICAAFSSRIYPNARRVEFLRELSLQPENLVMVKQVHSSKVLVVEKPEPALLEVPADGLITKITGLILAVRTADCVPIFLWDPVRKVAGIAHGGWKGVKEGIIHQMVRTFEKKFGSRAADLRVALGPSIRECCYEVGKEFLGYFPGFYHAKNTGKGSLNLVGVIRTQLIKHGISEGHIHDTGLCTVCENQRFFSYRVENQTKERILSVICILPT